MLISIYGQNTEGMSNNPGGYKAEVPYNFKSSSYLTLKVLLLIL